MPADVQDKALPVLIDIDELANRIAEVLQVSERKQLWVDRERHSEEHKFIEMLISPIQFHPHLRGYNE